MDGWKMAGCMVGDTCMEDGWGGSAARSTSEVETRVDSSTIVYTARENTLLTACRRHAFYETDSLGSMNLGVRQKRAC